MSSIVQVSKGDYVIVTTEKKRSPFLLKVSSGDRNMVSGVVCKDSHVQTLREVLDVDATEVLLNLGDKPRAGKVYGCEVTNLYKGSRDHDQFGPLYWFYTPKKEIAKDVMKGFDKSYKLLSKQGLEGLAGESGTVWEILSYNSEKYAGMYKHTNKEGGISRLQIRPEIMPATEYPYVILHELGHRLHLQYVKNTKLNAAWIKLYNTSIRVTNINKSTSEQLLEALLEGEDRPSDFKGQLEEENALAFKWICRYISQNHGITIKELDCLFEAEDKDEITSLWPTRSIPKKDLAPVVTEYATVNYKELFAESFTYHLLGKKLPKTITKLVERTISYAKTQIGK